MIAILTGALCSAVVGAVWTGLDVLSDKKPTLDMEAIFFGLACGMSSALVATP